jgi:hypothetical protein
VQPVEQTDVAAAEVATASKRIARLLAARISLFAAPPLFGMVIIAVTLEGLVSSDVAGSPAVMVTALLVGAALILGPIVIFVLKPDEYAVHVTDMQKRLVQLLSDSTQDRHGQPALQDGTSRAMPSDPTAPGPPGSTSPS